MNRKKKSQGRKDRRRKLPLDVEALVSKADALMESLNVEMAVPLYDKAALALKNEMQSGDMIDTKIVVKMAKLLCKSGEGRVSLGDPSAARENFADALDLFENHSLRNETVSELEWHDIRSSLLLYFGQLSTNHEALNAYKQGVDELLSCISALEKERDASPQKTSVEDGMIVEKEANDNEEEEGEEETIEERLSETRRQLCGAYCSLAELFLTDLCFEHNAEQQCESFVKSALGVIDTKDEKPLVDALQAAANLRLSQSRSREAVQCAIELYQKMKVGCEALAALVGLGSEQKMSSCNLEVEPSRELVNVEEANALPGYEFRCQTAKILLECASQLEGEEKERSGEAAESALRVLGSLLAEDDEVAEVWYLVGCAFMSCSPANAEAARQYWERAHEMLSQIKTSLDEQQSADEMESAEDSELDQQRTIVNQHMEQIWNKLKALDTENCEDTMVEG